MLHFRSIIRFSLISLALLGLSATPARASTVFDFQVEYLCTIECNLLGIATNDVVSGEFRIDSSSLGNSTSEILASEDLSEFNLFAGSVSFGLGDVIGNLVFDNSGVNPSWVGTAGIIAQKTEGGELIWLGLFPSSASVQFRDRSPIEIARMAAATITVSAVPVPAAVWLFGTALTSLIGFGKRKVRIAV